MKGGFRNNVPEKAREMKSSAQVEGWASEKRRGTSLQHSERRWLGCRCTQIRRCGGEKIKAFYTDCIYSLPKNKRQDHSH